MKVSVLFAVIAVFVCSASGTFASITPATTSQTWTFATEADSSTPDIVSNEFGSPTALISVDQNGTGYTDSMPEVFGSAQGWWDIGTGSIVLTIPNSPNVGPDTYKDITVWVKYWNEMSGAPDVQVSPKVTSFSVVSQALDDGAWWADTWSFHIIPNPDSETITLTGLTGWGSQIDEIRVDTVSAAVPEPGSLVALLSGLIGVVGVASRRKRV